MYVYAYLFRHYDSRPLGYFLLNFFTLDCPSKKNIMCLSGHRCCQKFFSYQCFFFQKNIGMRTTTAAISGSLKRLCGVLWNMFYGITDNLQPSRAKWVILISAVVSFFSDTSSELAILPQCKIIFLRVEKYCFPSCERQLRIVLQQLNAK